MIKTYPPREFPNLPSHEESLDLWRQEADRQTPRWLRAIMPVSFLVGLVLLIMWSFMATGRFELTVNGVHQEQAALALCFGLGLVLAGMPVAVIAWLSAKLPPMPTEQSYRQAREMMRVFEQLKEKGAHAG